MSKETSVLWVCRYILRLFCSTTAQRSFLCYPSVSLISFLDLENVCTQQAAICMDMGEYLLLKYTFLEPIFSSFSFSVTILLSGFNYRKQLNAFQNVHDIYLTPY